MGKQTPFCHPVLQTRVFIPRRCPPSLDLVEPQEVWHHSGAQTQLKHAPYWKGEDLYALRPHPCTKQKKLPKPKTNQGNSTASRLNKTKWPQRAVHEEQRLLQCEAGEGRLVEQRSPRRAEAVERRGRLRMVKLKKHQKTQKSIS